MENDVRKLLVDQLKDAYSAEKQALRCMQKATKKVSGETLRRGIHKHIEETQGQIERIEQALEKMDARPGRKVCEAMRGLVEEAQHEIEEYDGDGPVLDLVVIAGMQRIEHYEISAYGTAIALAKALGEREVAQLLAETLEEEKETDHSLTEITKTTVLPAAMRNSRDRDEPAPTKQSRSSSRAA